jgi:hypothetical protein
VVRIGEPRQLPGAWGGGVRVQEEVGAETGHVQRLVQLAERGHV